MRAGPTTTSSTGWPTTPGSASAREQVAGLVADPIEFTGAARDQVAAVVRRVEEVLAGDPEAAAYVPGEIL